MTHTHIYTRIDDLILYIYTDVITLYIYMIYVYIYTQQQYILMYIYIWLHIMICVVCWIPQYSIHPARGLIKYWALSNENNYGAPWNPKRGIFDPWELPSGKLT